MKNNIIRNGFFGGLIVSIVMISMIFYMKAHPEYEPNAVIEFTSIFLAFSFVIFGIKRQSDANNGVCFFGKHL